MRTVTAELRDGALTIFIERDIDHHAAKQIRQEIDDEIRAGGAQSVTLDFDAVGFMDSAGVGLILGRYKLTESLGIPLRLRGLCEQCRRVVELSGLSDCVEICK